MKRFLLHALAIGLGLGTLAPPRRAAAAPPPPPPVIPVPPGYGNYCSLSYPGGGWAFGALGAGGDPCGQMLEQSPGGTIERAGLWSLDGDNNVMVRCDGDLRIYRGPAGAILDDAYNEALGKRGCVFIVAPVSLPVFIRPYGAWKGQTDPDEDVDQVNFGVFNYDTYYQGWDVTRFGQSPNPPGSLACTVDRLGNQQCHFGTAAECGALVPPKPAGCPITSQAFEGAYDWNMPAAKPIVAVAAGIVRGSVDRDVSSYNCAQSEPGSLQKEIFIEHQIGSGTYAENFISGYHHMLTRAVKEGDTVVAGQLIASAGSSGCSTAPHLDFSVLRLTNLSGARSYVFETTLLGYGVNGIQGVIDPFGWAAPRDVDPWAWRYLGFTGDTYAPGVTDPGAFSINLWMRGESPPTLR